MDDKWRTVECHSCRYGLVSVYSYNDFEGAGECDVCGGSGFLFIRPGGHIFQYPGGPANGMGTKEMYEKGKPYILEEVIDDIQDWDDIIEL